MKSRSHLFCFFAALALLLHGTSAALSATIVYAGAVQGTEVVNWRTSSTAKTMDIDSNKVYGSMGAVNWQHGYTGLQTANSTTFGWAAVGYGTFGSDPSDRMIDSISNPGTKEVADYAQDYFTFQLTGKDSDYAGKTVRIGVMSDVLPSASWGTDDFKGYELLQQVGGTADTGVIPVRSGQGGDLFGEIYFFDIKNAHAGDQFQLLALKNVGGISLSEGYVGPVSFDIAATAAPEPGVGSLLLLSGALLGGRPRRSRR